MAAPGKVRDAKPSELSACCSVCRYFSIGWIRWLAGRDHRNPERNVYPSPDCRYVVWLNSLPDNLPVIPCACRAGMRSSLAGYRCGLSGAEAGPKWPCPGSCRRSAGRFPIHDHYVDLRCGQPTPSQLRLQSASHAAGFAQTLRQPTQQTPTTSHRETTN